MLPRAIEGDRAEQVDDDAGDDQRPGDTGQRPATDREQQDEQREVVEAEAIAELDPAAVLVEQRRQRDQGDAQPQRPVQRAPVARPEEQEQHGRGEPQRQAVAADLDVRRARQELGEQRERDG